jgi:gliding motility-associated-like protein
MFVIFNPLPELPLEDETVTCFNYPPYRIQLDAENPTCSYAWSNGDNGRTTWVSQYGIYTVEITTPEGCALTDSINVLEYCPPQFFMPNSFTPNGDGVNDRFGPSGNQIAVLELSVFDRWGQPIWSGANENALWDGSIGGDPAAQGVYIWKVRYRFLKDIKGTLTEYKEDMGHVTLLR